MAVPVLQSSSPADGATGISMQTSVTLTFNTALDSDSVNSGTCTMYRSETYEVIRCTLTVNGNIITMLPEDVLMESMTYKVVLSGDADNAAGRITSSGGDYLAADTTITFRTGTERYLSLEEVTERTDYERVGPVRTTDPLATTTTTGYLEVSSMTPAAYAYDVAVTTTGIIITFNQALDASADVDSLVTITQSNVFGMDNLYAEDTDDDGTPDFDPDNEGSTTPTGVLSISGSQIVWARQSDQEFLHNTKVTVTVDSALESATGASMSADYSAYFLTDMFPQYVGVDLIRLEIGTSASTIYDGTIASIIHKNSIDVWEASGQDFDIESPKWAHRKWVMCKTVIDIINVLTLASQLAMGQTKTLGDFSIQNRPTNPEHVYRLGTAEECIEDLTRSIWGSTLASTAIKGRIGGIRRGALRYRSWDRFLLRRVPIVGTSEDRYEVLDLDLSYTLGDKDTDIQDRYITSY